MKTKKSFDCVEVKRRGAEEVQRTLTNMTPEEEFAYWQAGTDELYHRQCQLRAVDEAMPLADAVAERQGTPN